jgi:hypothetical protein
MLFDAPSSAPLQLQMPTAGHVLVSFSTIVTGVSGDGPFEYELLVDNGPAETMPIPAAFVALSGGTPVSTIQLLSLPAGQHVIQVLVRSPSGAPITLSHSHLTTLSSLQ